jgi:hypothetical protein
MRLHEPMTPSFREALDTIVAAVVPEARDRAAQEVQRALGHGVGSLEELRALSGDRQAPADLRAIACWLLGRLGDHLAWDVLVGALDAGEPEVRAEAARALGALDEPRAVGPLGRRLAEDGDENVRAVAAHWLGLLGGREAFEALAGAFRRAGETTDVRSACAEALGDTFDPDAVPLLTEALADPDAAVRYDAAVALGQLADPRATERLRDVVEHDGGQVPGLGAIRDAARQALSEIEARRRPPGIRAGETFEDFARRELAESIEAAELLCALIDEVAEGTPGLAKQIVDFYPFAWEERGEGAWVIVGVHPETDVAAWERANRRLAAHVLEHWRRSLESRMPLRRPRVGWREGSGIEEWAEGKSYELVVFLDQADASGFQVGLPETPHALTQDEKLVLIAPRAAR